MKVSTSVRKILLVVFLAVVGLYYSPIIDQGIAFLPFDSITNKFYGETNSWCKFIYYLVPFITALMIILPVTILILYRKTSSGLKRGAMITLLSLAIGPGLIVNTVLKNHWGRARPYQVLRDHKIFSPVWRPDFNAPENNSFCSGHAAMGFFLGVPLLALRRKKIAIITSLCGGVIIGTVRILEGGHYLTDVMFAGVFVWLAAFMAIYITDKKLFSNV